MELLTILSLLAAASPGTLANPAPHDNHPPPLPLQTLPATYTLTIYSPHNRQLNGLKVESTPSGLAIHQTRTVPYCPAGLQPPLPQRHRARLHQHHHHRRRPPARQRRPRRPEPLRQRLGPAAHHGAARARHPARRVLGLRRRLGVDGAACARELCRGWGVAVGARGGVGVGAEVGVSDGGRRV